MQTKPLIRFGCALIASLAMAACSGEKPLGASISGVNYTDKDVRYRLFDPTDPEERILMMEDLGPYSAGGVLCCFPLPKEWKPGIKVGALVSVYDEKAKNFLPRERHVIELPSYDPGGKAGDVWFIRYPDGSVGVVSTNARPNGEGWPGKVKGWPVPSVEYRRKLWERDMTLAQQDLKASRELQDEFEHAPEIFLRKQWNWHLEQIQEKHVLLAKEYAQFSGPKDPAMFEYEKRARASSVNFSKARVDQLLRNKP